VKSDSPVVSTYTIMESCDASFFEEVYPMRSASNSETQIYNQSEIYLRILTEFSLQVEIEAYKIQYIYDMKFSLVSTTSQPQDEHK